MLNTKTIYELPFLDNVFFLPYKQLFFLKGDCGVLSFFVPKFYFIYANKIIFYSLFDYKSFLNHFINEYLKSFNFSFCKLKLRGLGYRVKHISNCLIRFFLGFTNYYFLHVPYDILIKAKRRRLLLISSNKQLLSCITLNILFLQKLSPYKKRGIHFPRQIILMKPGKKRF